MDEEEKQIQDAEAGTPEPNASTNWEFPGWGTAERVDNLGTDPIVVTHLDAGVVKKLGEWRSTAICGNDISSSCLYVAALCAIYAGVYAPIALLAVAAVLYLFRGVYAEVGSALPLNGGAYNVLLNTTTKAKASVAACLTLLSYVATAVISGNEAMHYLKSILGHLDVLWATVILLAFFCVITFMGIGESAAIALVLFVFHIATLILLSLACGWWMLTNPSHLGANWSVPPPGGIGIALFFGFSAAMLGISGFESSANFIEEQQPGVFPKTLRNMWLVVAIFNPLISFLSMGVLPLGSIATHKENLLAEMGLVSGGPWLSSLVSIDACLVLSGAVLTGYVGVTGLMRRMSLDRCLPQFLLQENRWRGTNHWILLLFFSLCCSILIISKGQIEVLAGVYTLSFLGVMALFAIGNMLLKVKRARLPRASRVGWPAVVMALVGVVVAIVGNLLLNPAYLKVFAVYFAVTLGAVGVMFLRVQILKVVLATSRELVEKFGDVDRQLRTWIIGHVNRINNFQVVFFSRGDDLAALNRAAIYVMSNEQTNNLRVVHCYEREEEISPHLAGQLKIIDRIYPEIRIDLVLVKGKFGPELIERLSRRLGVPKNYMFIGTPGDRFPHNIAELGGVRVVM
jgi:amino acid transporter